MIDLDMLLARHRAFWDRSDIGEPLVRALAHHDRRPLENIDVTPDLLSVEDLTPCVGHRSQDQNLVQGDLFHTASAFSRVPWMEAITGCPIHAGNDEAMWARPALGPNYEGLERIVPRRDNAWVCKLLALAAALIEANDGTYVVTQTLQRGPIDILSALMGDERMSYAFYDDPDRVGQVLAEATSAFIRVVEWQYEVIPLFRGGRCLWAYGLWAPGSAVRVQSDSASQLSPKLYREFVLPSDRRIMQAFDYSLIDLHSAGTLHLASVLLQEPDVDAISVTLDRYENAPSVAELLPTFAEILAAKSLCVTGEMTRQEIALLRRSLPSRGLCINATVTERLLWQRPV